MLNTITVAYKFRQEYKSSKRRKQTKNGQVAYQVLVSTQLGRKTNQTHEVPSKVTMPIPKPQTIYTTPIMTTQANIFVGWPPSIPINCEG
jgi:ribosomal protein L6P/L9E